MYISVYKGIYFFVIGTECFAKHIILENLTPIAIAKKRQQCDILALLPLV